MANAVTKPEQTTVTPAQPQSGTSLEGSVLSSEKALSKTGGAEISFYYFQKYEEEIRENNEKFRAHLESQRKDFQLQLSSERADSQKRLDEQRKELQDRFDEYMNKWADRLQKKEDEVKELNDNVVELSISNGFCRSLKWVNIVGAGLTLLGTSGASYSASKGVWGLVVILALIAILGSLLPQVVRWISEGTKKEIQ